MMFFFDNNLSSKLPAGLRGFGEKATHLQDHFAGDTPDAKWITDIAAWGWILVTRDLRIKRNPAEKGALREGRLGAFFLSGKNRTHCQLIQQVVRHWPQMKVLASKTPKPFAFRVPPTGTKIDPIAL